MNPKDFKEKLEKNIRRQAVSSRILLTGFRFIEEASKRTGAFSDPRYFPFYYHLGKYIKPKNLIQIGFRLGLVSGCFFKGCKTVENFLAFQGQRDEFYSPRLGVKNITDFYESYFDLYLGQMLDEEFQVKLTSTKWDLALINDETNYDQHLIYLDTLWDNMELNSLIVMDYINSHEAAGNAFRDFCKIRNREPLEFQTRYGVGVVQR